MATYVLGAIPATPSAYELFGHSMHLDRKNFVLHLRHMLIIYWFSVVELKAINTKRA